MQHLVRGCVTWHRMTWHVTVGYLSGVLISPCRCVFSLYRSSHPPCDHPAPVLDLCHGSARLIMCTDTHVWDTHCTGERHDTCMHMEETHGACQRGMLIHVASSPI